MYGISVETTFENGTKQSHRLDSICRPLRQTGSENLELMMRDVRSLLRGMQEAVLRDQIEEISETSRICPDCNKVRAIHDYRPRVFGTLVGRFHIKAPRIRRCACNAKSKVVLGGQFSPLANVFPARSTPELQRLQADLGARIRFRKPRASWRRFCPARGR